MMDNSFRRAKAGTAIGLICTACAGIATPVAAAGVLASSSKGEVRHAAFTPSATLLSNTVRPDFVTGVIDAVAGGVAGGVAGAYAAAKLASPAAEEAAEASSSSSSSSGNAQTNYSVNGANSLDVQFDAPIN